MSNLPAPQYDFDPGERFRSAIRLAMRKEEDNTWDDGMGGSYGYMVSYGSHRGNRKKRITDVYWYVTLDVLESAVNEDMTALAGVAEQLDRWVYYNHGAFIRTYTKFEKITEDELIFWRTTRNYHIARF